MISLGKTFGIFSFDIRVSLTVKVVKGGDKTIEKYCVILGMFVKVEIM